MFGRVLGGIATSILYSAFESWLIFQHNKVCLALFTPSFPHLRALDYLHSFPSSSLSLQYKYPGELLSRTFSLAVLGNGLVAIISGVVAYGVKEQFGMVAPFDASLILLIIGSFIIAFTWEENYGDNKINLKDSFVKAWSSLLHGKTKHVLPFSSSSSSSSSST
jgi:hypothetical protein